MRLYESNEHFELYEEHFKLPVPEPVDVEDWWGAAELLPQLYPVTDVFTKVVPN